VEPMPSMMSMPVASFHSARVVAGSASPADTHLRSLLARTAVPWAASTRYDVGAMKITVAPCVRMASRSASGEGFSTSSVDAPMLIGNSRSPPRPKVNASGGLPQKTSSARARSTCGGKHLQIAITSR